MIRSLLVLPFLLAGCDSGDSADTAGSGECGVSVTTYPSQGQVDAYYRGTIEFTMSAKDETATIETDIPGTQSLSADGLTVIWTPSAPLAPSTGYSATVHYCSGAVVLEFTTSALGTSIADPGSLQGKSYLLDLVDARITEPAGIGALLATQLDGVDIYIGVTDVNDAEIKMIGALGRADVESTQEYCDPSIDFPAADFTAAPYFDISGEGDTNISVAGVTVAIQNLHISGDFSADGSYFGGGVLQGTIDTRPLDPLLDDSGEAGAICETATSFGVTCQPCSDGEPYCLSLKADSINAMSAPLELVPILGNNCTGCMTWTPEEAAAASMDPTLSGEECVEDPNAA